jgi:hypothetical protein
LKEKKALFIYFGASDINHAGSIETQLRDGKSFCLKNMQRCCLNHFLMLRHAEREKHDQY